MPYKYRRWKEKIGSTQKKSKPSIGSCRWKGLREKILHSEYQSLWVSTWSLLTIWMFINIKHFFSSFLSFILLLPSLLPPLPFFFFLWDRISHCSQGWPRTHGVSQLIMELGWLPLSVILGLPGAGITGGHHYTWPKSASKHDWQGQTT